MLGEEENTPGVKTIRFILTPKTAESAHDRIERIGRRVQAKKRTVLNVLIVPVTMPISD